MNLIKPYQMMKNRSIDTLSLDGGWLCLDFINTVHDRTAEEPFEYLPDYSRFLDWSEKVELLTASERKRLQSLAKSDVGRTENVMRKLLEMRKNFYELFLAIAENRVPDDEVQSQFNDLLKEETAHMELRIKNNLEVLQQWSGKSDLRFPLWPIIQSAYELLISDQLDRVKECGACGWLFLDQSKNKSRKWCSMESCGSNVKARRYYHRHKKKGKE